MAGDLQEGDELRTEDNRTETVASVTVEKLAEPVKVYNLEIEGNHTYFVSDARVLVHNACGGSGEGGSQAITNDIIESPRSGSALKSDDIKPIYKTDPETGKSYIVKEFPAGAQAHGFNNIVDNYAGYATKTPLSNVTLYQLNGSMNGSSGRFEWIIQDGSVTHRMFIQGGTMNGVPIIK